MTSKAVWTMSGCCSTCFPPVICSSPEPIAACGGGGETLPLEGLPQQAGLALLGRLLGRPLRPDELPKAIRLWERAGGRPLALTQSAVAFTAAEPGWPLPQQSWGLADAASVAAQLSASARDTL